MVPKQRLLTLEDAAEAQNNPSISSLKREVTVIGDGDRSNRQEEGEDADALENDATDYADHLYDSDGGSNMHSQHQPLRHNQLSHQATFAPSEFKMSSGGLLQQRLGSS